MPNSAAPLIEARNLKKSFLCAGSAFGRAARVTAVNGASLRIPAGQTLALVGESGCGKSTLARCLALMETADQGEIHFKGENIAELSKPARARLRPQVQMIFQDAASAFNPRFSLLEIVAEPLRIQKRGPRRSQNERALELMQQVGLPAEAAQKRPLELSGGQRQRLALARALMLAPSVLILDEAFSGLDLSIQSQMVNLLQQLQAERSLGCLFISHDLALAAQSGDEVAVMYQGKIVEQSSPQQILDHPQHPHTRALITAGPQLELAAAATEGAL